jgi:hypothetical protein
MMIDKLEKYDSGSFDVLKSQLVEEGWDLAYGSAYSVKEIRKAIVDRCPVFIKFKGESSSYLVVGEKPDSLIFKTQKGLEEIQDNRLNKVWTGNAVIVLDEPKTLKKSAQELAKAESDFILFDSEKDTWSDTSRAKSTIMTVSRCPDYVLPSHPVIVCFQEQTPEQKKETIRAYSKGVHIYILDESDPLIEFLHELGHMYWQDRLTPMEREKLKLMHKELSKKNLPKIFMDDWSWKDSEEVFCTVYQWFMKGLIKGSGYMKILQSQYPIGFDVIDSIFQRVGNEQTVQSSWDANKDRIAETYDYYCSKAQKIVVNGKLIKAKLPKKNLLSCVKFPRASEQYETLDYYDGIESILVKSGILKGKFLYLNSDDTINFEVLKARKDRVYRGDRQRVKNAKTGKNSYRYGKPRETQRKRTDSKLGSELVKCGSVENYVQLNPDKIVYESNQGSMTWGAGKYFSLDSLAKATTDGYVIPSSLKIQELDITGLNLEQFNKIVSGESLKKQVLSKGYDAVKLVTDNSDLGGDQLIVYKNVNGMQGISKVEDAFIKAAEAQTIKDSQMTKALVVVPVKPGDKGLFKALHKFWRSWKSKIIYKVK